MCEISQQGTLSNLPLATKLLASSARFETTILGLEGQHVTNQAVEAAQVITVEPIYCNLQYNNN